MWSMIYPIMIIVASNVLYNICQKSTSSKINAFASLVITYTIAAVVSFIMLIITTKGKNSLNEFTKLNWASAVLGLVIVGLELGYILAYRNGWAMNRVSVTANITLAVILIFVAALLYKETINSRQIVGIGVCIAGLLLINL